MRAKGLALLLALLTLLLPLAAAAGKRSMIPPGREALIREFVDAAVAAARRADELPIPVDERAGISVDRDRIRVILSPLAADAEPPPRLVVFHPEAVREGSGDALAAGVTLECGPVERPTPCPAGLAEQWTPLARRLAAARDPQVEAIWQVEESGIQSQAELSERSEVAVAIDRLGLVAGIGLGLILLIGRLRRGPPEPAAEIGKAELAALLALLALFVGATLSATSLLPLHEHNSFIARSDCAIDRRCLTDPDGAWSMTTMHGYGLLLEAIPYRAGALAGLSLAVSVVLLALVWGLTRTLALALGRPELAGVAGISAVAILASNPIVWRLSGAATFWPWALSWALAAALAGLVAARACASEDRRERLRGAAAWLLAGIGLAFACAGNLVCLTLGPCLLLAPLCWVRGELRPRRLALGLPALVVFALLVAPDYLAGFASVFGEDDRFGDAPLVREVFERFDPILAIPALTTPLWMISAVAGLTFAGVVRARSDRRGADGLRLRVLLPLGYAYLVPAVFLGLSAGEIVGSGYPVGFINHHWELVWTAVFVGLALAVGVAALARRWPERHVGVWAPLGLTVAALLLAPSAREGWRMATGERVLERELVALERSFAALPEHDLLVVAPRSFAPLTDARSEWDPLEVVFPVGFYEHALRERGLEPALVVSLDRMPEPRPGERRLLYLGSGLRSFQPHEIAAGVVPDQLERPELARVRDDWRLEPALEFTLATAQHEAISQRLGADRAAQIELGFFWMVPHE